MHCKRRAGPGLASAPLSDCILMLTNSPSRLILTEDQQFLVYRKALIDFLCTLRSHVEEDH